MALETGEKDEITLPDGRVLEKPYIMSKNPAGLTIGHKSGVVFVPFSEMSEEQQKFYKYDPEKAKKYNQRIAQAQRQRQIKLAKKKAAAKADEEEEGRFDYISDSGSESSSILGRLESEMADLRQENARLKKEYSDVRAGRISPGSSGDPYMSFRGGKVYRKSSNRGSTQNSQIEKRNRLKELKGAIERNERRMTTVRNLIMKEKTSGLQKTKRVR
jgi:hypothetical protein